MKKPKNFWKNPWIVSTGSGLIVLIVTLLIDWITAEKIFNTIKNVLVFIWKTILAFLNLNLKLWWVLAGIVVLFLILLFWSKHVESSSSKQNEPEFTTYTKDTILQYKWKWVWKKDYYGKYDIEELHPICSKCETPLTVVHFGYGEKKKCLRCGATYNHELPDENDVEMLIKDNVRRKYYPDL